MIIQKKPDYLIFADSAKKGEVTDFPDVSRGWGITIDQTASKPPMEWMNGAFNRIDKNMLYLLQQGVPEWSESVTYPANAIIKYNGILYTAIVSNDNARPSTNTTKWKKTQDEIPNASITQNGIVKLNSSVNSTSEIEAATPKAINSAYNHASNAHQRITEVHDIVHNITDKFKNNEFEAEVWSPDKRFLFVVRNDGIVGMYSTLKNDFSWFFNHDGACVAYIEAHRVVGLDKFVNDRVIPVGVPLPWPHEYPPFGYFACNGSQFDKNQFPLLAAAYPSGFLPDLRGLFIRGKDSGRGLDPNRVILSFQDDAIRNIWGAVWPISETFGQNGASGAGAFSPFEHIANGTPTKVDWGNAGGFNFDASRVVPVAHENRPRNIAFEYIVKAA